MNDIIATAQETGASILLVEDEAALRGLTTRLLEMRGYCVQGAANGLEALAILDERPVERNAALGAFVHGDHVDGVALVQRRRELVGPAVAGNGPRPQSHHRHASHRFLRHGREDVA